MGGKEGVRCRGGEDEERVVGEEGDRLWGGVGVGEGIEWNRGDERRVEIGGVEWMRDWEGVD